MLNKLSVAYNNNSISLENITTVAILPHFYRVAAESFYTSASVGNLTYSRGGACPTGRGSTPCGEPRLRI